MNTQQELVFLENATRALIKARLLNVGSWGAYIDMLANMQRAGHSSMMYDRSFRIIDILDDRIRSTKMRS